MKTVQFLSYLRELDVELRAEGEQLEVDAPEGVLTPELLERLAARKKEILSFLRDSSALDPSAPPIERAPRDADLLLSHAQQRLWFLDQLEPGSEAYIMPSSTLLKGELDVPALQRSLSELVRRHESLRTVFESRSGVPRQVILEPYTVVLKVVDLSAIPEPQRLHEAQRLAAANSRRPFDLAKGPLFRAELVRLRGDEHVLLTAFHHIVFDAWSGGVFVREFAELYRAYCANGPSPLAERALQYVDFATWQRRRLDAGGRQAHLEYWQERLGGNLPMLELPADRPRRATGSPSGASCSLHVSLDETQALRRFSQKEGVTLSMTLLATFKVLLHRLTGLQDIIVGTPVAGRERPETEYMIGFFINTVVLRSVVDASLPFRTLLQQVRTTALGAYAHQEMPFEELVSALDPHRDLSRTPIFQVFFNHLALGGFESFNLPGITAEPFGESTPKSKFDLTLYVHELPSGIALRVVYNADLFDDARMVGLLEQYVLLLQRLHRDPDTAVGAHSLVTEPARQLLPDPTTQLVHVADSPPQTLACTQIEKLGERTAIGGSAPWTYQQLDRCATELAAKLRTAGVKRGDVVAILAQREPLLVCALLGVLRAGAAFAVLDPAYPDSRLAGAWGVARPVGLLRLGAGQPGPLLAAAVTASEVCVDLALTTDAIAIREEPVLRDLPVAEPHDLAYVAFTSGTTGGTKAIEGTHGPVVHFLDWQRRTFGLDANDRFAMLSGLSHDPLLRDVFAPLLAGATLEIPQPSSYADSGQLADWIRERRISILHATPALAETIFAASAPGAFEQLRYVFLGGDRFRGTLLSAIHRAAPHAACVNFYGATETPQAMGYYVVAPGTGAASERVPLGRGIEGVQLLVLNPQGRLAGVGELGEIVVRTPYLALGYRGDDALTLERFVANPFTDAERDRVYRTGDLGRYLPDGAVEFVGRRDGQVKVRGFRVELGEIEAALREHPAVQDIAATVRDRAGEQLLAAFVVTSSRGTTVVDFRSFLASRLPDHAIPSVFVELDRLPLTPNGKTDRSALPPIEAAPARHFGTQARRLLTPLENQLLVIWEQVLGRDNLQVTDNFFDLGGTSLTAVRLFSQLRSVFGKDLPLATLFQAPTVEKLAALMHSEGRSTRWKSLVAIQPDGSNTPLFMVPGVGGNVLEFARLANLLGSDQPFYGAQSRGLDGKEVPLRDIDAMAREYLKEIRELQPHGPYRLGGACMGGIVAFEMAQQLQASGEKVALLALIDTPLTRAFNRKRYRLLSVLHPIYFLGQGAFRHLRSLRGKTLRDWLAGFRVVLGIVRQMVRQRDVYRGDRNVLYQDIVTAANYEAMASYVPREYQGRLHLFVASERPVNPAHYSRLDWAKFATGGFSVFRINAKDSGELLRVPYVTELAEKIGETLKGSEALVENPGSWSKETSARES